MDCCAKVQQGSRAAAKSTVLRRKLFAAEAIHAHRADPQYRSPPARLLPVTTLPLWLCADESAFHVQAHQPFAGIRLGNNASTMYRQTSCTPVVRCAVQVVPSCREVQQEQTALPEGSHTVRVVCSYALGTLQKGKLSVKKCSSSEDRMLAPCAVVC